MRHQVLPATHRDSLYAIWNGQAFRAETSTTDGTVLLISPDGDAPAEFDFEHDGIPAKVVAADEVPHQFVIHTHCRYADETFAVAGQSDSSSDELVLRWTGSDEAIAAQLGLLGDDPAAKFTTIASTDDLTALWQERHDFFPASSPPTRPGDPQPHLRAIGRTLREMRPEPRVAIAAQSRQVGGFAELEVRAVVGDVSYSLPAPPGLGLHFANLRAAMYRPGKGTWFTGTFTLAADDRFDFDYDSSSHPTWRRAPDEDGRPTARAFARELVHFPRDSDEVPPWLGARAGLPLGVEFRHARVVDMHTPGERPVVDRPPVPPDELHNVLNYLYQCPVIQVGDTPQPDIFAPQTAPSVPPAFHTDGSWIWPAGVPHYLRMHGIAPEKDLLEHIRSTSYRPPFVSQRLRETAAAELAGEPYPPQSAADLDEHDPVTEIERDDTADPQLNASHVLALLRRRLDESGISADAYRVGEVAANVWCLRRDGGGWTVSWHGADATAQPDRTERFDRIGAAAAHLLGQLTLRPTRALAAPDEAEQPTDWPILPLRGEPPLTHFRGTRMIVLATGTEIVRFGDDAGNLAHESSARFRETSLLPDRERIRTRYRVTRPLRVLTGVSLPWGGMPGGALAYLLPMAVGHHVTSGALERLDPA